MSTSKSSNPNDGERQPAIRMMSTLALAGLLFFVLTVIISHLLRSDLSPARDFLSAYALGNFGFIMTSGFAAIGVSILLLAIGLWRYGLINRAGRVGAFLLGIGGMAMRLVKTKRAERGGFEEGIVLKEILAT